MEDGEGVDKRWMECSRLVLERYRHEIKQRNFTASSKILKKQSLCTFSHFSKSVTTERDIFKNSEQLYITYRVPYFKYIYNTNGEKVEKMKECKNPELVKKLLYRALYLIMLCVNILEK